MGIEDAPDPPSIQERRKIVRKFRKWAKGQPFAGTPYEETTVEAIMGGYLVFDFVKGRYYKTKTGIGLTAAPPTSAQH